MVQARARVPDGRAHADDGVARVERRRDAPAGAHAQPVPAAPVPAQRPGRGPLPGARARPSRCTTSRCRCSSWRPSATTSRPGSRCTRSAASCMRRSHSCSTSGRPQRGHRQSARWPRGASAGELSRRVARARQVARRPEAWMAGHGAIECRARGGHAGSNGCDRHSSGQTRAANGGQGAGRARRARACAGHVRPSTIAAGPRAGPRVARACSRSRCG